MVGPFCVGRFPGRGISVMQFTYGPAYIGFMTEMVTAERQLPTKAYRQISTFYGPPIRTVYCALGAVESCRPILKFIGARDYIYTYARARQGRRRRLRGPELRARCHRRRGRFLYSKYRCRTRSPCGGRGAGDKAGDLF